MWKSNSTLASDLSIDFVAEGALDNLFTSEDDTGQNDKTPTGNDTKSNENTVEISKNTQNGKDTAVASDSTHSKQDDPMDEDHDDFYNCTCKGIVTFDVFVPM